jgi:predicted transposase/invertase (TIGR01784 family)
MQSKYFNEVNKMRFIDPRTDFAFKKIFGSEESKPILISFLNALVYQGQPRIKDLEIIDPYQAAIVLGLKDTYLDVKAVLDDDTKVIIEMQYEYLPGFEQRILFNAAKGYANQLVRGQRYAELNSVIALTIVNFNLFKNRSKFISYFAFKEKDDLEDYPYSEITMIFVELAKFNKELEELDALADKWIYFLKKASELDKIPENLEKDQQIKQAFVIANESSFTVEELEKIQKQEFYRLDQEHLQEMAKKAEQEKLQAEQGKLQAEQKAQQAEEQLRQAQQQAEQQLRQAQQQAEQQARESKQTLLMRQLTKKLSTIDVSIQEKIINLSTEKLEELAEIFLDFESINDLISWLE